MFRVTAVECHAARVASHADDLPGRTIGHQLSCRVKLSRRAKAQGLANRVQRWPEPPCSGLTDDRNVSPFHGSSKSSSFDQGNSEGLEIVGLYPRVIDRTTRVVLRWLLSIQRDGGASSTTIARCARTGYGGHASHRGKTVAKVVHQCSSRFRGVGPSSRELERHVDNAAGVVPRVHCQRLNGTAY